MQNEKWLRMQSIVNQRSIISPINFKKIYLTRLFYENVLVFLLQYSGLVFSTLTLTPFPLWFASGSATGFVFLRGYGALPGVWLGTFLAYFLAKSGVILACQNASLFTFQTFILAWWSFRAITPTLIFYSRLTFIKFILYSAVVTAFTSYLLLLPRESYLQAWLGNLNGILIFSFGLIALDTYFPQSFQLKQLNKWMLGFYYSLFFLMIVLMLFLNQVLPWVLLLSALILLISHYYGWCGVIAAAFLLGFLSSLAASLDVMAATSLWLKIFLCVATVSGLFMTINKRSFNE